MSIKSIFIETTYRKGVCFGHWLCAVRRSRDLPQSEGTEGGNPASRFLFVSSQQSVIRRALARPQNLCEDKHRICFPSDNPTMDCSTVWLVYKAGCVDEYCQRSGRQLLIHILNECASNKPTVTTLGANFAEGLAKSCTHPELSHTFDRYPRCLPLATRQQHQPKI